MNCSSLSSIIYINEDCCFIVPFNLCSQNARSANLLDLVFRKLAEELGLHHKGLLRKCAFTQNFEEAGLGDVDHRNNRCVLLILGARLF